MKLSSKSIQVKSKEIIKVRYYMIICAVLWSLLSVFILFDAIYKDTDLIYY